MQKDNQFLLLKIIDSHGQEGTLFLGIGEVTESDAAGHVQALFKGTEQFIQFTDGLKNINHITTDGENKNPAVPISLCISLCSCSLHRLLYDLCF